MSGFHRPDRHCLQQARSAVRCSASRMRRGELHPTAKQALLAEKGGMERAEGGGGGAGKRRDKERRESGRGYIT